MFSVIKGIGRDGRGQATIEAAFVLPTVMLLLLLLIQPGIILYDRIAMESAAAEGCRLLSTLSADETDLCENYILRRLGSVPQQDLFHVHRPECTWKVTLEGNEASSEVRVSISTEITPLPLIGTLSGFFGMLNERGNYEVEVSSSSSVQPSWALAVMQSRSPSEWIGAWE